VLVWANYEAGICCILRSAWLLSICENHRCLAPRARNEKSEIFPDDCYVI
jgi:hypothetical protein